MPGRARTGRCRIGWTGRRRRARRRRRRRRWRSRPAGARTPRPRSRTGRGARKVMPVSSSSAARAVLHEASEELGCGNGAAAARRQRLHRASRASATAGYSAAGIRMRDRAADGPAVADLEVTDQRGGAGQQRDRRWRSRRPLDRGLGRRGADSTRRPVALLDAAAAPPTRPRSTRCSKTRAAAPASDQALAAGDDLRPVAQLGEKRHHLLGAGRRVVLERRGLHRSAASRVGLRIRATIDAGVSGSG